MPQLRIKNGPEQGKIYPLTDELVQLGREGPVRVADQMASRQHAEVFAIGDMYFIRDLGSRNGTYLNDERLPADDQSLLRMGDLVRIGSTQLVFEESSPRRYDEPEFTSGEEDIGTPVEVSLDTAVGGAEEPGGAGDSAHFSVLYDVARAVSAAFDMKSLMQKVCDIALGATPADAVFVFVYDGGKLEPVAHARRVERSELKISSTIIRRSLQHNRALLVSDALLDKRFSASSSVVMKGIRSVICAPLTAREHLGGVLYLHTTSVEKAFTDDHLRLVTGIALQAAVAIEAMRAYESSRRQLMSVFRTLIRAHETASPTAQPGHSDRVRACAAAIATALEVPPAEAQVAELAALLHEIGKIGAPEGAFQREQSRCDYATLGAQMLRSIEGLEDVAAAVEAHLERLDGTGGPRQLVGHQIPRSARIVALADEFERRLGPLDGPPSSEAIKQALMSLNEEAGAAFDEEVFNGLVVALRTGALRHG